MKYVVIGNGIAGITAASTIRKYDRNGTITILSDEGFPFYSRIRLIDFLSGGIDEKALILKDINWYFDQKIELMLNTVVTGININTKELTISGHRTIPYDRLLLATGGIAFLPPIPGIDKNGVFVLRTVKDAQAINAHVEAGKRRVILIGGGVLGLEAGYNLIKHGCDVTVVEFFPRLLPRQMDPDGAAILQSQMEKLGFRFHLGVTTKEIRGGQNATGIILDNATVIDSDIVLISAGVRPRAGLAQKLGMKIEKGVVVNDRMETDIPDIFAAGDLIQHKGIFYGLWASSEKQGEIAGINMSGGTATYKGTTISNILKVAGVDLAAAGEIDADGNYESIVISDREHFIYKKLVIDRNRMIGAILYGDISHMRKIFNAIEGKKDISRIKSQLHEWNVQDLS